MNPPLNAEDLISITRDFSGEHDIAEIPDGYPLDQNYYRPGIKILPWLNYALRDLRRTGFSRCYFDHTIGSGISEYTFSRNVGGVISSSLYDDDTGRHVGPVKKTSIQILDHTVVQWRNRTARYPTEWYQIGAGSFGLYPIPSIDSLVFTVLADSQVPDMSVAGDYPAPLFDEGGNAVGADDEYPETILPVEFHITLAKFAAWRICSHRGKENIALELKADYELDFQRLTALSNERMESAVHTTIIGRTKGSVDGVGWRVRRR